ncbi:hypothetical protein [Shewanella sp. Isolate11]|uniref:hypothetical protein n=1 Tax=Shewanella sp. Isolate11 TaxID=2908530 RepID=UPI001EFC5625|nr:hypothetical protein [Shewanella sp. Isolate11]MCG9695790.1 hypothetical protein [Shewanella sp. Isolate11]
MRLKLTLCILLSLLLSTLAFSGEIVVTKSSKPFDAFAVRDQVLKDAQWQQALRMQQQINILQALPSGCVMTQGHRPYFHCGQQFYRPYNYKGANNGSKKVYIQIDPPK